ncbi:MAG: CinA family protein [Dichotomicrobium sp.]
MLSGERVEQARKLIEACRERGLTIGTAESCTGGLVAACLTAVPRSSAVFERGFVTYSNEAKAEMLGVDPGLIEAHGAVSREVAAAMAEGVLNRAPVDLAISITGVAGPGGGSAEKPVGLVFIGAGRRLDAGDTSIEVERYEFGEIGRSVVRDQTVRAALETLSKRAGAD